MILSIRGLVKEYVRGKRVLDGITLEFAPGGITAVIGPSGTGKSTLIRCINRLVEPTAGEILFGGQRPRAASRARRCARRAAQIGMVFQEYNLVERLTVMENLLCGPAGLRRRPSRRGCGSFPRADVDRAFALLDRVGLAGFANQRADALSGGQRQRVGIARAVMQEPEAAARRRADLLARSEDLGRDHGADARRRRASTRIPVIVNMHDVELARRFAGRIVGMSGGQVVYDGPPARARPTTILKTIYGGEDWLA